MAATQVPTIPYLSTPQEKQNFLDAVLLVSLDDIQRPQHRLEKLDGLTPTEQLDLTLLARGNNLVKTSGINLVKTSNNNTTPARTLAAPKLPPGSASAMSMSLAAEVSWKTTRFLSALFRLMLRGPPPPCKRPSSNSVAFAHTMLINGAEGPAMSLCAQAMKSAVVHKVVDGVVGSRREAVVKGRKVGMGFLKGQKAGMGLSNGQKAGMIGGGRGKAPPGRGRRWDEDGMDEHQRAVRGQEMAALDQLVDEWIEMEDKRARGLLEEPEYVCDDHDSEWSFEILCTELAPRRSTKK